MKPVFGTYADGDVEGTNKPWSKWAPSGHLTITITNPDAIEHFVMGNAYYLDSEVTRRHAVLLAMR